MPAIHNPTATVTCRTGSCFWKFIFLIFVSESLHFSEPVATLSRRVMLICYLTFSDDRYQTLICLRISSLCNSIMIISILMTCIECIFTRNIFIVLICELN